MKLTLKRTKLDHNYTAGELYIDNVYFSSTLEDPNRDLNKNGKFDNGESKVYGNTCIPYGTYEVILSYSPKFKRILPEVLKVGQFAGIRFHRGNYVRDTEGCILIGEKVENGVLNNSTPFEKRLIAELQKAINRKESITLEIL